MTKNKLQPNGERTEAMLIETKQKLSFISANILQLGDITVPLSDSVKSPGVLLLLLLRRRSSLQKHFSNETVNLVTPLILSCLYYSTSVLSGLPASCVHAFVAFTIVLVILKKKILY